MTKEQILEKNISCTCNEAYKLRGIADPDCGMCNWYDEMLLSMTEFSNQELTAEREKAAKLVNSLEMALQILEENQKERHPFSIRMIRQSLTEYKSSQVNALTNSNESPGSDKE